MSGWHNFIAIARAASLAGLSLGGPLGLKKKHPLGRLLQPKFPAKFQKKAPENKHPTSREKLSMIHGTKIVPTPVFAAQTNFGTLRTLKSHPSTCPPFPKYFPQIPNPRGAGGHTGTTAPPPWGVGAYLAVEQKKIGFSGLPCTFGHVLYPPGVGSWCLRGLSQGGVGTAFDLSKF